MTKYTNKIQQLTVPPMALLIALTSEGGPTNKLLPVSTIPIHPPSQPIFSSSPKANLKWYEKILICFFMEYYTERERDFWFK